MKIIPPYSDEKSWNEVNSSINYLFEKHNVEGLKKSAGEMKNLLQSTFSMQDELCFNTCIKCLEPCCSVAKIWFDIKDLLFLNLLKIKVPDSQPRDENDRICKYYKPLKGCVLNRLERPFICNYFLCNTQKKNLRKNDPDLLKKTEAIFFEVKKIRNGLEDDFIKITVADPIKIVF